jgi:hypothetical protein
MLLTSHQVQLDGKIDFVVALKKRLDFVTEWAVALTENHDFVGLNEAVHLVHDGRHV